MMSFATALSAAMISIACGGAATDGSSLRTIGSDGIPLWEHTVLPLDQRGADRIELVKELVIGAHPDDPNQQFFRARDIVVDHEARIYVLDAGNKRVQVFGAGGAHERTIGSEGQGPGELQNPDKIALGGNRLVVNDPRNARLSAWDLSGELVGDYPHGRRFEPFVLRGSASGRFFATYPVADDAGAWREIIAEYDVEGREVARVAELPRSGLILIHPGGGINAAFAQGYNFTMTRSPSVGRPTFAVDPDSGLYLTSTAEYEIQATDPAGDTRWRLRAAWTRIPYPVEEIDRRVASMRERRAVSRSNFSWDDTFPALDEIQVDGHGHLFVYPTVYVPRPEDDPRQPLETRPVDVYSSEGELLYSGAITNVSWHAAHRDLIYSLELDPDTGEQIVVGYRFVEPFE